MIAEEISLFKAKKYPRRQSTAGHRNSIVPGSAPLASPPSHSVGGVAATIREDEEEAQGAMDVDEELRMQDSAK
jgi:hypothetical protein